MASILVVCTGNVCRSPAAEGFLRRALVERLGDAAPRVRSAGTAAWVGSAPTPESVAASAERGVDTSGHVAQGLSRALIDEADLVVAMAGTHADLAAAASPGAADTIFTLKELVRLLEAEPGPPPADLAAAVRSAATRRAEGFVGNAFDEDVADPLGMPMQTYRAMAWELDEWTDRLATAIFGPAPARAAGNEG